MEFLLLQLMISHWEEFFFVYIFSSSIKLSLTISADVLSVKAFMSEIVSLWRDENVVQ